MIQRTPFKSLRLSACGLPVFFGVLPRNGSIFSHRASSISYRLDIFALSHDYLCRNHIIHDMSDSCKMLFDYFRRFSLETYFSIVRDAQTSPDGHHTPFAFSFLRIQLPVRHRALSRRSGILTFPCVPLHRGCPKSLRIPAR